MKIITRADGVKGIVLPYPCKTERIAGAMRKAREMRAAKDWCVVVFDNKHEMKRFNDGMPTKEEILKW